MPELGSTREGGETGSEWTRVKRATTRAPLGDALSVEMKK
jgi:hypothetical protein